MGPGIDGVKYIFIVRDDHSSYVWLFSTVPGTSEEASQALKNWIGAFGAIDWLLSDQSAHFKNKLMADLVTEFHAHHHFTTAYSPWANGTVERIFRECLCACEALCSEWRLSVKEWPAVVESIKGLLNHAPLKLLGLQDSETPRVFRTPLEVFTGNIPVRPLMRAFPLQK